MTAGQGPGPYGSPPGQGRSPEQPDPQGWGAPQGQPPYGQHPAYPGYGPAPSAPTGFGAPKPVERPLTVRAGIGAFVASILLSLIAQVITLFNMDELTAWALADADADLGELSAEEAEVASGLLEMAGPAGVVVGLVFTAVFALFVWFAWKGHNWARIVLWVLAGLGLLFAPVTLAAGGPLPVLTALTGFEALADLVAVVLLALKPSHEWYRYRGWLRATGQPG